MENFLARIKDFNAKCIVYNQLRVIWIGYQVPLFMLCMKIFAHNPDEMSEVPTVPDYMHLIVHSLAKSVGTPLNIHALIVPFID